MLLRLVWIESVRKIYFSIANENAWINPFHVASLFLYPLKTSENQTFSETSDEMRDYCIYCECHTY